MVVVGGVCVAWLGDTAPHQVTLAGTSFAQLDDGLVLSDFRPGIPAWIARQAARDFTATFDLVSLDLRPAYPPGPYRLLLHKSIAGYADGLTTIERAPAFCATCTLSEKLVEPIGDRVRGIPVTGGQGGMDFLLGHELTDGLVAYTGGIPFAPPCTRSLLTPWINDGFADCIGDTIGGRGYVFTPLLQQIDHVSSVAFERATHTPVELAALGWPTWRQGYTTPQVSQLESSVADEMVRAVLARGGTALFKRVVLADGGGRSLIILGESSVQLADQASAGDQKWYAGLHLPAAYFGSHVWLRQSGRPVVVGRVYAFGLQPGAHPQVDLNGAPAPGPVPAVGPGGLFFMSVPRGVRQVTVDGMTATPVSAHLAQKLMAGLGQS